MFYYFYGIFSLLRYCEAACYARFSDLVRRLSAQVEPDDWCRSVINLRISDGLAPEGPLFMDVEAFNLSDIGAEVDGLVGGFPRQAPFAYNRDFRWQGVSRAGKQAGMSDCRSSLVQHFFRLWDQGGQKLLLG